MSALPSQKAASSIRLCRLMRPDDANVQGNAHGGTILTMIEEAGSIVSTRHCNNARGGGGDGGGNRCVAALARVDKAEFLHPVFIGDAAHVSAEITYASERSLEVQVSVASENVLTGAKKLTNTAALWYVPLSLANVDKTVEVPPVEYASPRREEEGRKRYEAQKMDRQRTKEGIEVVVAAAAAAPPALEPEEHTAAFSQSSLIRLVGPSDCTLHDLARGGVTMKLMDEVAGIVAARHCHTRIVTACVDAVDFLRKVRKGAVVTATGRMIFTSERSMQIEVFVDAVSFAEADDRGKYRAATAVFTYTSLDQNHRPLPVPPLKVRGEDEEKKFKEGESRYLRNKAKRMAAKQHVEEGAAPQSNGLHQAGWRARVSVSRD